MMLVINYNYYCLQAPAQYLEFKKKKKIGTNGGISQAG